MKRGGLTVDQHGNVLGRVKRCIGALGFTQHDVHEDTQDDDMVEGETEVECTITLRIVLTDGRVYNKYVHLDLCNNDLEDDVNADVECITSAADKELVLRVQGSASGRDRIVAYRADAVPDDVS